jgi:hypothetical protein
VQFPNLYLLEFQILAQIPQNVASGFKMPKTKNCLQSRIPKRVVALNRELKKFLRHIAYGATPVRYRVYQENYAKETARTQQEKESENPAGCPRFQLYVLFAIVAISHHVYD